MTDGSPGAPGMTSRQAVLEKLWFGRDPFEGFESTLAEPDLQGWNSQHPYLEAGIISLRPSVIVEVGVWKGGSAIFMADALERHGVDGVVVAVDTWLGSSDHWMDADLHARMGFAQGRPQLYATFASNVALTGTAARIVPLPLDSQSAAELLSGRGVSPDILHIDAGHSFASVTADLRAWWPLLRPGGLLIGDDYWDDGAWWTVRKAFDEFFDGIGLSMFQHTAGKCLVIKPR